MSTWMSTINTYHYDNDDYGDYDEVDHMANDPVGYYTHG